jgi:hypothetical protein
VSLANVPELKSKIETPLSALMVIEDLTLLSFFPVFKIFWEFGPVSIYYVRFTGRGIKMVGFLQKVGIVNGKPIKISNTSTNADSPDALDWDISYRVLKICQSKLEQVKKITKTFFLAEDEQARVIMTNNVILVWAENVFWPNMLLVLADRLAKEVNISSDRVFVASTFSSLSKALDINFYPEIETRLVQQPFRNKSFPLFLWAIYLSFRNLFSKSSKSENTIARIGFSALFHLKKRTEGFINDLFWWREKDIPGNRLVYMFNRPDISLSPDKAQIADSLGIETVALNRAAKQKNPIIPMTKKFHKPLLDRVRDFFFSFKIFLQSLFFDEIRKSAMAFLIRQYAQATQLASFYRFLNIKGFLDNSIIRPDYYSLAACFSDSVRFGYQKSCRNSAIYPGLQVEPVHFSWGKHDTNLLLGSGSITRHMLISGCILNDNCDEKAQKSAKDFALSLRDQGVSCILSFFDSSFPPRNIYRKLLEWLIEDPQLGLLIKSKGHVWSGIQEDGLDGLVERAKKTGRIQALPSSSSPADAALVSDFSIGYFSYSAIVTSALKGARILYLSYERIEEPQKSYCTLHSLGPNRCVFNDFDSMKSAVIEYVKNPKNNPDLGDVTPVLDHFDPFRDGKAGDRISEYVSWYLEGLDKGISRDDALNLATQKYADKWGADKVIRGL